MRDAEKVRQEVERGEILRFLLQSYPQPATPTTLRNYLDERGYPLSERAFSFHVHYLAESGLVTYETFAAGGIGEEEEIRFVKISKGGIDEVEHRGKGKSGVRT